MRFPYTTVITQDPDTKDYFVFRRPELQVRLIGAEASRVLVGLADTGADRTILPKDTAYELGIDLSPGMGGASTFGGHAVNLLVGEAQLEIEAEGERVRWKTELWFHELSVEEDTVLLGHAGFLDYFSAEFDGEHSLLTLKANGLMPRE